ncbi:MAG: hypothetical protein ACLQGV_17335, partial [Bryobacteraceae bacterium]
REQPADPDGAEWVSIHAPRAGRDLGQIVKLLEWIGFNPRAPRGARLLPGLITPPMNPFQSTRPARGATPSTYLTEG